MRWNDRSPMSERVESMAAMLEGEKSFTEQCERFMAAKNVIHDPNRTPLQARKQKTADDFVDSATPAPS